MVGCDALRPLDEYGAYLELIARAQIGALLRAQVDAADLAQETLLKAHRFRDQFRGRTEAEFATWLRTILAREIAQALRKRGAVPGCSLEAALDDSAGRLESWIAADQTSPSQYAVRSERAERLARALAQLPVDQRTALELRHIQGLPVPEVARCMERSVASVTGLLQRGGRALRELLGEVH